MYNYNREIIALEFEVASLETTKDKWTAKPERNPNGFRDLERQNKIGHLTRLISRKKRSIARYEELKILERVKRDGLERI